MLKAERLDYNKFSYKDAAMLLTGSWYDHQGRLLQGYSLSEACDVSSEYPEKLLILIENFTSPTLGLFELTETARFIISTGKAFFVANNSNPNIQTWIFRDGIQCEVITRAYAKELVKNANLKKLNRTDVVDVTELRKKLDTISCSASNTKI